MDSQETVVRNLVMKVKEEIIFSSFDLYSFVSPSAYDTAWLAMIPHPQRPDYPLFKGCLDWVLHNQKAGGFWGETNGRNLPIIDCLTETLACIVALRTWKVGDAAIQKGLVFIHANTKNLLKEQNGSFPRWFAIIFPAMVELAQNKGLNVNFCNGSTQLVEDVFVERQQIFKRDALCSQHHYPTQIIAYLEALPNIDCNEIIKHQSDQDGSILQSPSATAYAFMTTGNEKLLAYLKSIVQRCGYGVPQSYPVDENLIKICLVDRIERLGLADHFSEEIKSVLAKIFRIYIREEPLNIGKYVVPLQIYTDSLAFRLLRLHGYQVSPWRFCWFLNHEDILVHMEENYEYFLSAMYNLYRAADVMFKGENQLELARTFSGRILNKATLENSKHHVPFAENSKHYVVSMTNMQDQIKHEISRPWLARLDHLEHRKYIEEGNEIIGLWTGKSSFYRLSCLNNATLLQLAIENYTLRQAIYRNELMELQRWSKGLGLCDMGFAREKTTYCYFAVAATVSLPSLSDVRLAVVKSAILVTVADDFFDTEGSLDELKTLTNAIQRWEEKGLKGHSKIIFNAVADLVSGICRKFFEKQGYDIKTYVQDIWHQTFLAWLKEAEWSRSGHVPLTEEYLQVAVTSVATQTIVLPASVLLSVPLPIHILKCPQSDVVTSLLMVLTRLLNDTQSYQREQLEGKWNLVLLHLKENPNLSIEDSIALVQKTLDEKKKEFLEHALVNNDMSDMSEACKQIQLSCLKAFQMFYNSTNAFNSPTELLADIKKAIYDPLRVLDTHQGYSNPLLESSRTSGLMSDENSTCNWKFHKSVRHEVRVSCKPCNWIKETSSTATRWQGKPFVAQRYYNGAVSFKTRKLNLQNSFLKPIDAYVCYPCFL